MGVHEGGFMAAPATTPDGPADSVTMRDASPSVARAEPRLLVAPERRAIEAALQAHLQPAMHRLASAHASEVPNQQPAIK